LEKKRKIIYLSIGGIGFSAGLLAIILMIKNYQNKKAEAEVEQPEKDDYLEDLESERGYNRKFDRHSFRVIDTYSGVSRGVREKGRFRQSGRMFGSYY